MALGCDNAKSNAVRHYDTARTKNFMSKWTVHRTIWQQLSNKMQQNTVYLNLSISQHVSVGICTTTLYLQYLALVRPLLLPDVNVAGRELNCRSFRPATFNRPEQTQK